MLKLFSSFFTVFASLFKWRMSPERKEKKEVEKQEKFDEALAENNLDHLGSELSDNLDKLPD